MDSKKTQMNVVVHKAAVSLMEGETLADYTQKLTEAARAHVKQKLNLSSKDDVWSVEVFGDSVVLYVFYDQSGPNPPRPSMRYQSCEYARDATDGKFTFSKTTEVVRVTRFEAVADVGKANDTEPLEIAKASKAAWEPAKPWAGVL